MLFSSRADGLEPCSFNLRRCQVLKNRDHGLYTQDLLGCVMLIGTKFIENFQNGISLS